MNSKNIGGTSFQTDGSRSRTARAGLPLPPKTLFGFLLAVVAVAIIAALSYSSLQAAADTGRELTRTVQAMAQVQALISTLKDAETGQRGFLLTGEDGYLEPYSAAKDALADEFTNARSLLASSPEQQRRLASLHDLAAAKMDELGKTVALRRAGRAEAALAIVGTDRGKIAMDRIRATVDEMLNVERQQLAERSAESQRAATMSARVTWGGSGLLLIIIALSAAIAAGDHRARQVEAWLQAGQMQLSVQMQGDQRLATLAQRVITFLAQFSGAQVGAIYLAEGDHFRRVAGYAVDGRAGADEIRPGDGLAGQAARDNRALRVKDVPRDYLPIRSVLGTGAPAELLIAPASASGVVHAVVELGFFGVVDSVQEEFLRRASESMAIAVRTAKDRSRLEELLQETQQQAEELQSGQEELRVSNEELEEQSSALKESHAQMESQQAELEQINSQLEEQTQLLEQQRDELTKTHAVLSSKAEELQRANDYKSEFLANMSHELRTPLNSTLILAKLLADNKDGNLTDQQVKFAQTINSAGNDLLTLINDVLDLSRIEAGKVDLAFESVPIGQIVETMAKAFQPVAEQKSLQFHVSIEPGVPDEIETDAQRLGQILKNLLSNAFKFTRGGEVALRVFADGAAGVSFAVRDTGVGIAPHQQEIIFEAFRQADGSIHRKYGGTGLGLSISRDLAQLLGGAITVQSTPGEGSVFTVALPMRRVIPMAAARPSDERIEPLQSAAPSTASLRSPPGAEPARPLKATQSLGEPVMDDDRDVLIAGGRLILVVEDDTGFALVLRDLAHEMGFQCVVTHTAGDGLLAASTLQPSAVLLDINLPDHSGLGVLDQLKRDPRTRHIPVHVASVADYRREALELGAVGYAFKPAKREQLVEALEKLAAKLSQSMRRVLIVEDDPRQRDSIRQLLTNGDVEVSAVASAGEALTELRNTTFDCMVMDFNLPDLSGYDLLEKMAQQDEVSFPPVIVYTGRALTRDEEQRLLRYSKSIIIKDARSPERLLDEVTLFLHQVESTLPLEHQQMLKSARHRESSMEGRRILVVEDDVRNIFALSSVLEPKGATIDIARNGREALDALTRSLSNPKLAIDLVLMDIMMPEMDGLTAMREIRKRSEWRKLPIIALTAKAMKDDQEKCLAAGANDYMAKPLDVEKLLSLVRVWMPK